MYASESFEGANMPRRSDLGSNSMKNYLTAIAALGAIAGIAAATLPAAHAGDVFSFSFNTGNVAFAYSDGYWDRDHQWHNWRNAREAREYRAHYAATYKNSRHNHETNNGWRDDDHDGVANRNDRAPHDPRRN
jgi:hypothetical protein